MIYYHICCIVKAQSLYNSLLLTSSVLSLLSCGLLAVGVRSEVSNRQTEISRKPLRADAVLVRVLMRQIRDSRATMPGADVALWCAELLCTPGTVPPPGITSG